MTAPVKMRLRVLKPRSGVGPEGDLELMPENHVLEGQVAPRANTGEGALKQAEEHS